MNGSLHVAAQCWIVHETYIKTRIYSTKSQWHCK